MATWNRANLIGRAIESAREQTFQDWELIIADDGSSDGTEKVVEEWQEKEPRIIYTRSEVNQGISKNYNRGFRLARGEYIAMIDDDDPWCDRAKLQKQIDFLDKHPEYVGCGGGVIVVVAEQSRSHNNPELVERVDSLGKELYRYLKPETDQAIRNKMLFGNPMANSTSVFRRSSAEKVGWYDESMRYSGDRDFWLKMGLVGKLYNFPEYFSYYRMTSDNTSIKKIRPHLKSSLLVMKRYKGKYPHYGLAFIFNEFQYAYSFIPEAARKRIHPLFAKFKRRVVG